MHEVYLIGMGQTPVTKKPVDTVANQGAATVSAALADAGVAHSDVGALYVGNMLSGMLSNQQLLAPMIANAAGLDHVEAATVESACCSGAAAARWGYMAVAGGFHEVAVVCGVEHMTHVSLEQTTQALATASHWPLEGSCGETFLSLNAGLMARYMETYGVTADAFAPFAVNAHCNALTNPNALLKKDVDIDTYMTSRVVVDPVKLFDASPVCNGSAAVVLASKRVAEAARLAGQPVVRVAGSAVATDSVALSHRKKPLFLEGVAQSSQKAYQQAGVSPADIDIYELHDAYTIISVLSLEAAGFADPGTGTRLGQEGVICLNGDLPISTMGGLKSRGHPVGATGVYQLAETYLQLTDQAGENQVNDARVALVQNIGGAGGAVVSHILAREA